MKQIRKLQQKLIRKERNDLTIAFRWDTEKEFMAMVTVSRESLDFGHRAVIDIDYKVNRGTFSIVDIDDDFDPEAIDHIASKKGYSYFKLMEDN